MITRPSVRLSQVWLRRSGHAILSGIDWTVRPGEQWVVLGPNGSGKTSLLQLASTYELPSSGSVSVLGHTVGTVDVRCLRRRIGYTSSALEPYVAASTTVRDLILTGKNATLMRWTDHYDDVDVERAETLAAHMGLRCHLERRFATLSQGERRRAQLGRALMDDPDLLLLDEPTSSLDLGGREEVIARLAELGREGPEAIVMVTHHVEEIPPGFTHVALLRGGRLLAAGPIEQVLTAAALSACFAAPLELERRGDRFFAWQA